MYAINKAYGLDAHFDKLWRQISDNTYPKSLDIYKHASQAKYPIENVAKLEKLMDSLSVTSKSQPLLQTERLLKIIAEYPDDVLNADPTLPDVNVFMAHVVDTSWLVAAKAAVQTLGVILNTLSDDVLSLNDEMLYWDSVLESPWSLGLYMLQISPVVLWNRSRKVWHHANSMNNSRTSGQPSWMQFYESVRQCVLPQNLHFWRGRMLSPLSTAKSDVRQKQKTLSSLKDMNAYSIGILIRNSFSCAVGDNFTGDNSTGDNNHGMFTESWQINVLESVALMKLLLEDAEKGSVPWNHEEHINMAINQEVTSMRMHYCSDLSSEGPRFVMNQLGYILEQLLPAYAKASATTINNSGRPHYLVRFWLPLTLALLSTSTSLELLRNRRHELLEWVANFGSTTIEFWNNWVVDPLRRLIGTIRHDEKSEIALMSRNSLEADRASLERMVVDFVLDRCEPNKNDYDAFDTHVIAAKVREGDLTPVLKAYENDLRSPFVGTIKGDLVRALLIQIQKTKVDVEIAIGGIDALLKSQELVFGFIGLTPGLMVSFATLRWLYGLLGSRRGFRMGKQQDELRHALRIVHRTLTSSASTPGNALAFRDYGLLICNAEVLLSKARIILKGADLRSFQEDINELVERDTIDRQLKVVERMGWVYSKWI
ncbi:NCA2 family protein [Aspergillus luchuensis]|uniref:Nuclear control of ATPase protein 2 n=1 Tax=Aspergillus kawachii TaxID=1069201 RepID=A0A7R7W9S6_ASPKA|nr:nuclear control of ATPase protein 2 [Aspergillus luchuensis]BCR99007.1 nuclear control of ATPase protein 2 [Aspergillus luchuensis]BCS11319.1 nuclear control of ATPase protein 2 [Aspergillus luchuensis]GAA87272.1 ATP synthase regulation protein NCA2 [Aspergillus luchuensis IFO 4308]